MIDENTPNLSTPTSEADYWNKRYGVAQPQSYSRKEFIDDHYNVGQRIGKSLKQMGTSVAQDFYIAGGSILHSQLASGANYFDTPEIIERRDTKAAQILRDLTTLREMRDKNNQNFVNEAVGGQLVGQIELGLLKTGINSVTGGVPITTFAGVFGDKYTQGMGDGMSSKKAYAYAMTSGGVSAAIEFAGSKFLPKGVGKVGKVLMTGVGEALEEVEDVGVGAAVDALFYDGKPPGSHTEGGVPQWDSYFRQLGKDAIFGAAMGFVVGGAMGGFSSVKVQNQVDAAVDIQKQSIPGLKMSNEEEITLRSNLTEAFTYKNNKLDEEKINAELQGQSNSTQKQVLSSRLAQPNTNIDSKAISELNRVNDAKIKKDLEMKENGELEIQQTEQLDELRNQFLALGKQAVDSKAAIDSSIKKQNTKFSNFTTKYNTNLVKNKMETKVLNEKVKTFLAKIDNKQIKKEASKFDLMTKQGQISFLSRIKQLDSKTLLTQANSLIKKFDKIIDSNNQLNNIQKGDSIRNNDEIRKYDRQRKNVETNYKNTAEPIANQMEATRNGIMSTISSQKLLKDDLKGLTYQIHNYDKGFKNRIKLISKSFTSEIENAKPIPLAKNKVLANAYDAFFLGMETIDTVIKHLGFSEDSYIYKQFVDNTNLRYNTQYKLVEQSNDQLTQMKDTYKNKTGRAYNVDAIEEKTMTYMVGDTDPVEKTITMNVNSMIDVFIKSQNQKTLHRLIYGNKIDPVGIQTIINNLTTEQKEFGINLMKADSSHVSEVSEKYEQMTGERFDLQENYFTAYTDYDYLNKNNTYDDKPEELELLNFVSKVNKQGVKDSITKKRSNTSAPLELDAYNNFVRSSKDIAHYLSFADHIAGLNTMLSSENRNILFEKGGKPLVDTFSQQIVNIARDNPNFTKEPFWKMMKGMRINNVKSVLPFKVPTMMLQPVSALSVCDRVGYPTFFKATSKVISDFGSVRENIKRLDPKTYYSGYNLAVDQIELDQSNIAKLKKIKDTPSRLGFLLFKYGDTIGKTVAWDAAFEQAQQDNPGGTENNWSEFASRAIAETQPTTLASELPKTYHKEWYRSIFGAFSNQRTKYLNRIISNVVDKKISPIKAVENITKGVLLPQLLVTMIQNGFAVFWNEDDENRYSKFGKMYLANLLGMNPIISFWIGLSSFGDTNIFSLSGLKNLSVGVAELARGVPKGEVNGLDKVVNGVANMTGIPISAFVNMGKGLQENIDNNKFNVLNMFYSPYMRNNYFED